VNFFSPFNTLTSHFWVLFWIHFFHAISISCEIHETILDNIRDIRSTQILQYNINNFSWLVYNHGYKCSGPNLWCITYFGNQKWHGPSDLKAFSWILESWGVFFNKFDNLSQDAICTTNIFNSKINWIISFCDYLLWGGYVTIPSSSDNMVINFWRILEPIYE